MIEILKLKLLILLLNWMEDRFYPDSRGEAGHLIDGARDIAEQILTEPWRRN